MSNCNPHWIVITSKYYSCSNCYRKQSTGIAYPPPPSNTVTKFCIVFNKKDRLSCRTEKHRCFYRLNKSCQQTCQLIFLSFFRCYLNCKPRVATSLMISIRVKCTTCSRDDEKRAVYKWNLVEYDPATKATRAINEWENWLETGQLFLFIFHKNVACLALDINNCCWVFSPLRNSIRGYTSVFWFCVFILYCVFTFLHNCINLC